MKLKKMWGLFPVIVAVIMLLGGEFRSLLEDLLAGVDRCFGANMEGGTYRETLKSAFRTISSGGTPDAP